MAWKYKQGNKTDIEKHINACGPLDPTGIQGFMTLNQSEIMVWVREDKVAGKKWTVQTTSLPSDPDIISRALESKTIALFSLNKQSQLWYASNQDQVL